VSSLNAPAPPAPSSSATKSGAAPPDTAADDRPSATPSPEAASASAPAQAPATSPHYESSRPAPALAKPSMAAIEQQPVATRGGRELRSQTYLSGQYVGEFNGTLRHGMGRFEYSNGNHYTGSWEDDKKQGFGMLRWTNGDVYCGGWRDNRMCGYGQFVYANGNSYAGQFVDDVKEGYGRFAWKEGDVYEGEWEGDVMSGKGTMRWEADEFFQRTARCCSDEATCRLQVQKGQCRIRPPLTNALVCRFKKGNVYTGECRKNKKVGGQCCFLVNPYVSLCRNVNPWWNTRMPAFIYVCRHVDMCVGVNFCTHFRMRGVAYICKRPSRTAAQ
jgi:hypothetical protein